MIGVRRSCRGVNRPDTPTRDKRPPVSREKEVPHLLTSHPGNLTWRAGSVSHVLPWQRAHCTHASSNLTRWGWRPGPHQSYLQPYFRFLIIDPSRHITEPFCMNSCTGDYIAHIMWIINPPNLRSALEVSVTVVYWRLLQAGAVQ